MTRIGFGVNYTINMIGNPKIRLVITYAPTFISNTEHRVPKPLRHLTELFGGCWLISDLGVVACAGLGFRGCGFWGFSVWGLGFKGCGFWGFSVWGLGFRGCGFWGFSVWGLGFRGCGDWGFWV